MCGKKKDVFPGKRLDFPGLQEKERNTMSNNSNNINIPEAKQAMEQFKMQAANDEDVPSTS